MKGDIEELKKARTDGHYQHFCRERKESNELSLALKKGMSKEETGILENLFIEIGYTLEGKYQRKKAEIDAAETYAEVDRNIWST